MESDSEPLSPRLWRSLDELADAGRLDETLREEFPRFAHAFSLNRRRFVKLMAASMALAGAGCSRPLEKIVPYVRGQPQLAEGQPLFFATAVTCGGYATGVLVESNNGRPTKIEGNAAHPASLGATDAITQATVLDLWDPDRSQSVMKGSEIATWQELIAVLTGRMHAFAANGGAGLRILTETVTSPTLAAQLRALLAKFPNARWHQYEPVNRDNVYEGARLAFGEALETRYLFDKAEVVVSLDADFLGALPGHVRYARDFVGRRRIESGRGTMNRLYAIESTPSLTGAMADHRLPARAGEIGAIARSLAKKLGVPIAFQAGAPSTPHNAWIDAVADDLAHCRGAAIVVAGDEQPPAVHALAHAINAELGNLGATVIVTLAVAAGPDDQPENQRASLESLTSAMAAGEVDTLVVAGNPIYHAPADTQFSEALRRVKLTVHLGLHHDETAAQCHWHVPAAHELETWGDARAFDGTVTLLQPLIAPLYGGKSLHELLAALAGELDRSAYEIVREHWRPEFAAGEFESRWQAALHDGRVAGSSFHAKTVALRADALASLGAEPAAKAVDPNALEIVFRPDPSIHDGRYANNAWLQELPRPLTKLTWGNAALMSPELARRIDCVDGDVVELRLSGRRIQAPVWQSPGHPDRAVTVTMGYGRTRGGRVGTGIGYDAFALRTAAEPWFASGLAIVKTGRREQLATTQHHHGMEGRDIVRTLPLAQLAGAAAKTRTAKRQPAPSLYPPVKYDGYAWGMSVNLNTCIGCNACTIACQAENNIPVVGKDEVANGREMHWIRVDRYYEGEPANPRTHFQPVPCMQCDDAPCEVVCPTAASVHNSEGLNVQVYNRCVGTRFCSNNCPYKVRRFNFFQYAQDEPSLNAQRNPEVTVRQRGVMEKCSYCIQRIAKARIEADKDDRRIRDGEVVTACQAACPTGAIVFGDLNDPTSEVVRMKSSPLDYALLEELNTKPRTTYLAKVTNPNPELKE